MKSDSDTEKILKGFANYLKKDVGAVDVKLGNLEGKLEDKLKFNEKEIFIKF